MNRLGGSAALAVAVHLGLLIPLWGRAMAAVVPTVSVTPGVSRVELEWAPPSGPEPARASAADGEGASPRPAGRRPASELSGAEDGALPRLSPSRIRNPAPRYPWLARVQGWEGTVIVRAVVTPRGQVASVVVARRSGYAVLDQAAVAGVQPWRFEPARRRGGPVAATVEIPIVFTLAREENR